jgi:LysR family nitrogen assimilation transcriptional regulator
MNLKQLIYFTKIIEHGNITRAAQTLGLAQTALGVQIRNLEDEIGVPLFERHSRGVRPTRAGKILETHAHDILQRIDAAAEEVRGAAGLRQISFVIGVTPSIMRLVGAELLTVSQKTDAASFRFVEELSFQLLAALSREEIDYAFAFNIQPTPGVYRQAVLEERLYFITADKPGRNSGPIGLEEILRSDLALLSSRDIIWTIIHRAAARRSLTADIAFEVQSTGAIKALVERGVATSVMPYGIIAEELSRNAFFARPIADTDLVRTLYLIWSKRSGSEVPEKVRELLFAPLIQLYTSRLGPQARLL